MWLELPGTEKMMQVVSIPEKVSTLAARTVRNVSYIGFSQIISLLASVGTVVVLSRILTPEDFGIAGIGIVFLNLFYGLQNFGVLPAVIQRDTRIEESISVGLSLRWMIAAVLALFMISVSQYLSEFFATPEVALVLIVCTVNLFILPLGFSSQVLLTRALRFSSLATTSIVQWIVTAAATIALAILTSSYWSLVYGSILGSIANVAMLNYFERRRFRPRIDLALMAELLGFGKHLLVTGLMAFVIFNVDQLVIAKVLSVPALGAYIIAVKFGRTIGRQISEAVNQVLFPTMARIKHDLVRLKTGYVQSLRMISMISVPLCMGISAISPIFVEVVLGPVWLPAVVPISILSFQGLLNSLIPPAANVLISLGKLNYMSVLGVVHATVIAACMYPVASSYGIEGVCWLTTILSFLVFIYYCFVFSHIFRAKFMEIVRPLFSPLLSGSVMFVIICLLTPMLDRDLWSLASLVSVGGVTYFAILHVSSRGKDIRDLLRLIRSLVSTR